MINVQAPEEAEREQRDLCESCEGSKKAPIAAAVTIGRLLKSFLLCEECARDTANAVAFMCIGEEGWSKLEPRKKKAKS